VSLALRDSDRALALAIPGKSLLWHPEKLISPSFKAWRGLVDAEAKTLRLRFHTGPVADSIKARAMTWTRRDIALADGIEDSDNTVYCPLVTEEICHVWQIKKQSTPGEFQAEYVFRVRLRWAYETQPSCAILRWMKAQKALRRNMIAFCKRRAASFARHFPGYNLGRIANLERETIDTLMRVVDG
jgi:hypothetical protein